MSSIACCNYLKCTLIYLYLCITLKLYKIEGDVLALSLYTTSMCAHQLLRFAEYDFPRHGLIVWTEYTSFLHILPTPFYCIFACSNLSTSVGYVFKNCP